MRTAAFSMLAVALGAMSTPAWAASDSSGAAQVSAYVPAVCEISADNFYLSDNGMFQGSVQEFCNTSTGFQILASHRPLDLSEDATVQYGANLTALGASGMEVVAFRSGQSLATVPVVIDARNIVQPLAVAFSVSAV